MYLEKHPDNKTKTVFVFGSEGLINTFQLRVFLR